MSKTEVIDFACPKCREAAKVTIYRSINATEDPAARQLLLDGRVNAFACSKCGNTGYLLVSLLYHDMTRRFVVQYHPFPAIRSDDFMRQFDTQGQARLDRAQLPREFRHRLDYFAHIHVVFDMGELMRYVLFRERLAELEPGNGK